jgi:predicted AAA+ superfamily ATPase
VKAIPEVFHAELIELLKKYLFTGGMPEVVADYVEHRDLQRVRDIQMELLRSYVNDFAKHSSPSESIKIKQIWDSIPLHLSKENRSFVFSAVKHSARAREYEAALQWLQDAGLILKVQRVSRPFLPLCAYAEKAFKVYLFDVGLLGAMTRLKPEAIVLSNELFTHFKGALVENYAIQQLCPFFDLFYWASSGKAELDLVIQTRADVLPVEIKAGVNLKAKSLKVYDEKYSPRQLVRCSLGNFSSGGKLIDLPLFALDCLATL